VAQQIRLLVCDWPLARRGGTTLDADPFWIAFND
jgi:hypothetical protein